MKKQDLLSIRKFSELTGIKQSTLRYYDEAKVFQPVMRGENNYRYYSAPQTIAVNRINVMHSLNIPLKKIIEFREDRTPEKVLELLQEHGFELNRELLKLHQAYSLIHTYCALIQEGLLADEDAISVRRMSAIPIELGPVNDFSSGYYYESFFKFIDKMGERNIHSAYPTGGFYDSLDDFVIEPGRPVRYFSHFPAGRDIKKSGEYLVGYARGDYGELGDLPERMRSYAKDNGLLTLGPVYEMYLHDEIALDDPDRYLIQASTPVSKAHRRG